MFGCLGQLETPYFEHCKAKFKVKAWSVLALSWLWMQGCNWWKMSKFPDFSMIWQKFFKSVKTELLNIIHDCPFAMSQFSNKQFMCMYKFCMNMKYLWNSPSTPISVSNKWYTNYIFVPSISIAKRLNSTLGLKKWVQILHL